ncbi:MAG TPA: helix-hairpin-helix domain-containing protein [Candidatus Baltobacteraceae bacterium]|jgi:competence protein ComEA
MTRFLPIVAGIVLVALAVWHPAPNPATISAGRAPMSAAARTHRPARRGAVSTGSAVVVYVAGAVARPGVYHLSPDARAMDAVSRAGGFTGAADRVGVNLAEHLVDGQELAVPKIGESLATQRPRSRRVSKRGAIPTASIDLNAAGAQALAQLPGIGPTLAQRIVDYRDLNGRFASLDELADVSGMTDRRIQEVAPFILVH